MERKKVNREAAKGQGPTEPEGAKLYDLETPRWSKYYQRVRKSIRFPRYYKRSLNW